MSAAGSSRRSQTAATYAATGFARDMLSVKDNLERALAAIPEDLREDERMKAPGRRHRGDRARARQRLPAPRHRPGRGDRPAARPASPPGDDRGARATSRARHDRPGDAGRLHDQGPAAAAGFGRGGEEGLTPPSFPQSGNPAAPRYAKKKLDSRLRGNDDGGCAAFVLALLRAARLRHAAAGAGAIRRLCLGDLRPAPASPHRAPRASPTARGAGR